ncbi:PREDICTED: axin-2 isoform X2 [Wasmannia auropunctata]|uniref:axin-2 isoform X2 n=1 Tax=Wasmannia auropunctata TaxID=64793 RepID=UPI0005ED6D40|nr:PREDICTED: axin-2 isoform X2 [Wasmannia auropunctata]
MRAVIDRMSLSRQSCFNENSPRPPVPGEETGSYVSRIRPQSPALTPRRSSFATPQASGGGCDVSAPLGFEPEGCCGTTTMESNSPPAYARWARNLHSLLEDPVGLELFKRYLSQEGHLDPLHFWFACEGLKEQKDREKMSQLVKLIYRRFFLKSQLSIPEDVMKEADRRVKEGRTDHKVFDIVQLEVERLINETTYPNFLQSDVYVQYVQSCQNPDSGGCPSSSSGSREMSISCGPSLLPTVHEDSEYVGTGCIHMHNSHSTGGTPGELRLTKDMLMATQQSRAMDLRPRPEAFAGIYLQHGASPYHMHVSRLHAQYSSYNPVSRQDSELQSLSSDARTEVDSVSLTDGSVDGTSSRQRCKKQYTKQSSRAIKESANINRESMAHHVVPRTQRITLPKQWSTEQFAEILTQKLKIVAREQEAHEKLEKCLHPENDAKSIGSDTIETYGAPKTLGDALKEKLSMEEDSDQAILDEHVSRVWSDQTPSRSPNRLSPERRRPAHNYPRPYKQRKEKDMDSTFSVDSGNIHDFQEGSDLVGAGSMSSLGSHLPKSKSVPSDYGDFLHKDLHVQGHDQRFRRSDMARRSATKKSMTELTDSGVSVVSDVQPSVNKDVRTIRFKEVDKKIDLKHSSRHKRYGSRSESLERSNRETWSMGVPAQPFVADPGMPPLTPPHTVIQLEETCRRLLEENKMRASCKQRHLSVSKQPYELASQSQPCVQSNQSTLRKPKQDDFTTVVFSFCDEQFPYRTKIPGHNVTLKQFKEYLPKKGSYRYFFKTECEDLDTKVIQEEITDDAEILPLWEGKVMAQVKALE